MSSGGGEYYIALGREDYYTAGGEPPGQWLGSGAKELGFFGAVEKDAFRNLLTGHSPEGKPLLQNAGDENHQAGWDFTFSAPKSVSVIWSQADPATRRAMQNAHQKAVEKAIGYLENAESFTRRGKGGTEWERAKLIVATFEHGTSRAQDPQLHTHALIMNVCVREDDTTGALLSKPLFKAKMAAGAIYRAELAHQLEEKLSLVAERKGRVFEIKGVSKRLMDEFSKRREAILEALEKSGFSGAKAAAAANLATREVKGHIAREELFINWHLVGMEHGFSLSEVKTLLTGQEIKRDLEREKRAAVETAITKITESQSHFSERDLIRHTAEEAQGRGLSADHVLSAVKEELTHSSELVRLGQVKNELRYTTKENLLIETKMLAQVMAGREKDFSLKEDAAISQKLSEEQKKALHHIAETRGAVKVVSGMAGTGKTTLLNAAREVWEASGFEVRGAALSGKAAQGLEEGAGIKSETIHKTLSDLEKGNLKINSNTILVIDEAGMVGTRQMARLVDEMSRAGGKLVLVGDARQLQPIDAGGPFRAIAERIGAAELTDIRRQRDERDREAIKAIAGGRAERALQSFAERGLLTVTENRREAMKELISDWKKIAGENPKEVLIITGTRLEAATLNKLAQEDRKTQGELGSRSLTVNGTHFYENDRILFTKNSRLYGVKNGSLGTIDAIDERQDVLRVKLDSGAEVRISARQYENVSLGYAVTTHKGQGVTVEKSFVLSGGEMTDRELSYVQASRAKGETRIYTDRSDAGDLLTALARRMNNSRQKDMAVDVLIEEQQRTHKIGQRVNLGLQH